MIGFFHPLLLSVDFSFSIVYYLNYPMQFNNSALEIRRVSILILNTRCLNVNGYLDIFLFSFQDLLIF